MTEKEPHWYNEQDLKAANDYAERTANGEYPLEITRERDIRVGASDFLAGVMYAKNKYVTSHQQI